MRFSSLRLSALLALALSACGEPSEAHPIDDAATPSDAAPGPDAASPEDAASPQDAAVTIEPDASAEDPDAGPPPSEELVALYDDFLVPHCGGSMCHMPGDHESSYFGYAPRLQMPDARSARRALVDQPVDCVFGPTPPPSDAPIRVVPGDPEASAVMLAASDGLCGRRHNIVVPELTPEDLEPLAAWIRAGAP